MKILHIAPIICYITYIGNVCIHITSVYMCVCCILKDILYVLYDNKLYFISKFSRIKCFLFNLYSLRVLDAKYTSR